MYVMYMYVMLYLCMLYSKVYSKKKKKKQAIPQACFRFLRIGEDMVMKRDGGLVRQGMAAS